MAKCTQREVDPQRYALSRRRFLPNAGIGAASFPFLGSLADTADAESFTPTKNPWPSYPAYKFAFVCQVTADVFFNAVRAGANDICALLGTSYTWTGSENDIIPEMVNAFKVAINNEVDGNRSRRGRP
jgi:simple sugar transport system substrate-binding protein